MFRALLALAGLSGPDTASAQSPRATAAPSSTPAAVQRSLSPFAVRVVGKGAPMLFIPGLTSGAAVWDDIVAAFSDRYECHVLTLPGFAGQPPVVADSTWLLRMRDAVIAYVREQQLERPVIVGHSLGGFLALDIAATSPALARAVINVDGLPFLSATMNPAATVETVRPMAAAMRQMMRGERTAESAQMQEMQLRSMVRDTTRLPMLRAMGQASDAATVAEAMYALYTTDLRPRLSQVSVPVLNLHAWVAYRSFGQTREGAERLFAGQYASLRNATTRISDTAYHFIMLDEPDWLVGEMRGFLASAP